jgi:branched-chain amino acid transport system substrate-binding protein
MLADAKGIDANLIGEHRFVDYVADDLRVRQELPSGPVVMSPKVSSPNSKCCAIFAIHAGHWRPAGLPGMRPQLVTGRVRKSPAQCRSGRRKARAAGSPTFSGPTAVIGNDMRNSFELALDHLGRKMGGKPVEVIYEDDQQKPDVGKQKTEKLVQSDHVDFIVGYIWSNVLLASLKTAVDSQDLPDRRPTPAVATRRRSVLALRVLDLLAKRPDAGGDGPVHESEGRQVGVPDRPELRRRQGHAGRREEHLQGRGRRRGIHGVAEPARLLGRTVESARLGAESIFVFYPGAPACSSSPNMRRPASSSRSRSIRSSPSTNCRCRGRRTMRSAFPARRNGSTTCPTRQNKKFVADYRKKYKLRPTYYGAQAYDARS